MALGYAITDAYSVKFKRGPAGFPDAFFDTFCDLSLRDTSGNNFVKAVDDGYNGLIELIPLESHGKQQCPARCPV
jgi:hypothetical protein